MHQKITQFLQQLVADQLQQAPGSIGLNTGFYELGLNSRGLIGLAGQIDAQLGVRLQPRQFFRHASIEKLAAWLETHNEAACAAWVPPPAKTSAGKQDYPVLKPLLRKYRFSPEMTLPTVTTQPVEMPLSEAQKGLWALQRMSPSMSAYNVPICFETDPLDPAALERACRVLVDRYPILSHVFKEVNGDLVQYPNRDTPFSLAFENLAHLSRTEILAAMQAMTDEPFDLSSGPLLRITLIEGGSAGQFLLCVVHHIVFDGASYPLLTQTLFEACSNPTQTQISPPPFSRYVAQERERLNGPDGELRLAYWREKLAGPPPVLKLPTDFPRSQIQAYRGDNQTLPLSPQQSAKINAFAQANQVYLPTLFLAAFKLLLNRYSGSSDLTVGLVTNGRPNEAFNQSIGFFIEMLPIRSTLNHTVCGRDFVADLQDTALEAMANSYPFPALVRELDIPYNLEEPPVFQVAFTFQDAVDQNHMQSLSTGSSPTMIQEFQQSGGYELGLEVFRSDSGFNLMFKYNPSLYTTDSITRMLDQLSRLLQGLISQPQSPCSDLPMLSQEDRQTLLVNWNDTTAAYPADKPVTQLFQECAQRTPDKTAVLFEGQSLTYAQLDQRSDILAHELGSRSVSNQLIGICTDRSLEMVIGLLAIMKSGAAYVPLDPDYPKARLQHMIEDSGISLVLSLAKHREILARLTSSNLELILLDSDWQDLDQAWREQDSPISPTPNPNDLAYTIYTSGSTGKPKGVMIPHRALTNFLVSMSQTPGMNDTDTCLAVTTYCFDIAGLELYLPLITGATLIVCSSEQQKNGSKLLQAIRTHKPTIMQATPATWTMLFLMGWNNEQGVRILCGGEALPASLNQQFINSNSQVWNMFGPTETTIWSTVQRILPDEPITIGQPIANTQIYILDANQNPAPINVPGELYIGGHGVAKGYWKREELTASRFVDDPFGGTGKLYRTGDLARRLPNGNIDFLGRMDDQVKLRGYRIELGEIETQLTGHPKVQQAVVVIHGENEHKRLVAFVVPTPHAANIDRHELRQFLEQSLPAYMIPAVYVTLADIPKTPNGKIHRTVLAKRPLMQTSPNKPTPPSQVESKLLKIWRDVLRIDDIDIDSRFFEAGGTSISAITVTDRINAAFPCPFDVTALFQNPTVRAIAKYLMQTADKEHLAQETAPKAPRKSAAQSPAAQAGDVPDYYQNSLAIVGISCHFPGADGTDRFWENLCSGYESGVHFSEDQLREMQVPEHIISHPGFVPKQLGINDKEYFDPDFFGISPKDATLMDPQFRQLLQHSWSAVEDAGYTPDQIPSTSVFMSAGNNLYQSLNLTQSGPVLEKPDQYVSWLLAQTGTIPTMISYKLGLTGPSLFVHTNCSSTLTGLNLACQSLLSGESDQALVGGATISASSPVGYLHQPGLNFSSDGKLRPFDAKADGMIAGEGVGVLLLKRATDAVRDRDHIYALVRGTAVNNDGGDKLGFYAPGVNGQTHVIQRALERADVDPQSISYVEAHGTGTSLGDPIEFSALRQVYRGTDDYRCGLGSVKSNLGHLDTAAGLAGCIKVALSLYHQQIPPTLHYQSPNPKINFADSPFHVVDKLQPWPDQDAPRRAAISSFGIGGTNAHAILEAPPQPARISDPSPRSVLIPLSANTPERLQAYAQKLRNFIAANAEQPGLSDLAFTFQVGRKPLPTRLALRADNPGQLLAELDKLIESQSITKEPIDKTERLLSQSDVADMVEKWVAEDRLDKIAQAWMQGYHIDWNQLWAHIPLADRPRRISLPSYPFAREYYWPTPKQPVRTEAVQHCHPLVHRNISNLNQQRFVSTFTGAEFFLAQHVIEHRRILPGVAFLEMARAAVTLGLEGVTQDQTNFQLKNIVWRRPISVEDKPLDFEIGLQSSDNGQISYQVTSQTATETVLHHQGTALLTQSRDTPKLDLDQLRRATPRQIAGDTFYQGQESATFLHGPAFRGIHTVRVGQQQALARLEFPTSVAATISDYIAHPSMMDSAVQVALHFANGRLEPQTGQAVKGYAVPFALQGLEIFGACSPEMWAWVRHSSSNSPNPTSPVDIDLCDASGEVRIRMTGLAYRFLGGEQTKPSSTLQMIPAWTALESVEPSAGFQGERHLVILGFDLSPIDTDTATIHRFEYHLSSSIDQRYQQHAAQLLELIQHLHTAKPKDKDILIQLLVPAAGENQLYAGLFGLLQTAHLEHPKIKVGLLEMDVEAIDQAALERALQAPLDQSHQRILDQTKRMDWIETVATDAPSPWREGGIYLISGGAGGLGLLLVREIATMVDKAALILLGRSPLSESQIQALDDIRRPNLDLQYHQVDITDKKALKTVLKDRQLTGVLHLAGALNDGRLVNKTPEEMRSVLAPKVTGTTALDQATRNMPLDFFVMFSSVSALGNPGQADYAAANAFMDAYADYRSGLPHSERARGKSAAVNWPLWQAGGMSVDQATRDHLKTRYGFEAMPAQAGFKALYAALAANQTRLLVLSGDPVKLRAAFAATPAKPKQRPPAANPTESNAMRSRVFAKLKALVSSSLQVRPEKIHGSDEFEKFGFDSISLTDFSNQLNQQYGLELIPTVMFEYPTLDDLTNHLIHEHSQILAAHPHFKEQQDHAPVVAPPVEKEAAPILTKRPAPAIQPRPETSSSRNRGIAIVGISGVFPMAENVDGLWENLIQGRDCISEVPADRWDWRTLYGDPQKQAGKTDNKWGGFAPGIGDFDALFFGISPREARFMDPQQRLLMTHVWLAIEDAGYAASSLSGRKIGMFIGTDGSSGYSSLMAQTGVIESYSASSGVPSMGPNRMSYFLNFNGPSEPVETACSSSLVAIDRAIGAMNDHDCEGALVGGVHAIVNPGAHISFSRAGALAGDGRCKTFSSNADGFVLSEGAGILFLKHLDQAEADGDHIYAVVAGSAVNHGGKASSLTAPNPKAQTELLKAAYTKAGIDPSTVGYIETHGTGTKLGDPAEVGGLKSAFKALYRQHGQEPAQQPHCGLGSIKSNMGHLVLAAGVAGVIKVLLQLKHKTLVRSLHCEAVNPYIKLENSPFFLVKENQSWPAIRNQQGQELPRRAGVSSFGIGGANAHVILEEYTRPAPPATSHPVVFVLSARDESGLKQYARKFVDYLAKQDPNQINLPALAFTLQTGRDAFSNRFGAVVDSPAELSQALEAFLASDQTESGASWRQGRVSTEDDTLAILNEDGSLTGVIDSWVQHNNLAKILEIWIKGCDMDWTRLYDTIPTRLSLPTYPFARKRYWIPPEAQEPTGSGQMKAVPTQRSLLGVNQSDLDGLRFQQRLEGDEFFLRDHRVNGTKMLPGVAYLEMAAAAYQNLSKADQFQPVRIEGVVWSRPVTIDKSARDLDLRLYRQTNGVSFEVQSTDQSTLHAGGRINAGGTTYPQLDLALIRSECNRSQLKGAQCYTAFGSDQFILGPSFRAMTELFIGHHQVLARIELPEVIQHTADDYIVHPSLLDSSLQASSGLLMGLSSQSEPVKPALPFALESIEILQPLRGPIWARVLQVDPGANSGKTRKLDLDLCDENGHISVRIRGFSFRIFENDIPNEVVLLQRTWRTEVSEPTRPNFDHQHVWVTHPAADLTSPLGAGIHVETGSQNADLTAADWYTQTAIQLFKRIKALAQRPGNTLLRIVARSPVERHDHTAAGLAGLLRTASREYPALTTQLLLHPERLDHTGLTDLLKNEEVQTINDVVRYDQNRQVLDWREVEPAPASQKPWRSSGVYLITGGLGGLGLVFAHDILTKEPKAKLILTGRRPLAAADLKAELASLGPLADRVSYHAVDICQFQAVEKLIAETIAAHGALNGILHCAGVINDGLISTKTEADFQAVLAPKVMGTTNLDRASRDLELDVFVLFSSLVSQLGNPGQADYAAANGFMDAYADHRQQQVDQGSRFGQTLAINWPLWEAGGMTVSDATRTALANAGLAPLSNAAGLNAFYQALASGLPQVAVVAGKADQIRHAFLTKPQAMVTEAPDSDALIAEIRTQLGVILIQLLDLEKSDLDPNTEFDSYGLESIMLADFANALNEHIGLTLLPTVFFEHPTLEKLARFLAAEHSHKFNTARQAPDSIPPQAPRSNETWSTRPPQTLQPTQQPQTDGIAVIGMSGRFPMAENLDELWHNLAAGRDCITEIPPDRWDWRAVYGDPLKEADKTHIKWGGFLDGVGDFDPRFFGISPKEAEQMDPNQRLLMTWTWLAIEDAGYAAQSLAGQSIGIFAGTTDSGYSGLVSNAANGIEGYSASHMAPSMGPNRMSFFLDFHGPSEPIETACSSSLVAVHRAVEAIRSGSCNMALAGGVNTVLTPGGHISYSKAKALSASGRCKTFAADADGFAISEGVAMLFLKPLTQAEGDGDHIYGIIRATAENHGGRANSLSSPNPTAQAALLEQAFRRAQVDPATLGYMELHGTGTKLGDPAEVNGLKSAFKNLAAHQGQSTTPHCGLGSIKSNIGHAVLAAGVAGVIKVLLQMKHETLVDSLHGRTPNPYIELEHSSFYIVDQTKPWPRLHDEYGQELPRRAGVSSFGFSGVNAHVVLEEYRPTIDPTVQSKTEKPVLIVLSAKNSDRLAAVVTNLLDYLTPQTSISPQDLAVLAAQILDVDPDDLESDQSMTDYGLDPVQKSRMLEQIQTRYQTVDPSDFAAADTLAQMVELVSNSSSQPSSDIDLRNLAYTLQVGRNPMTQRLALAVSSIDQLVCLLRELKDNPNTAHPNIHRGRLDHEYKADKVQTTAAVTAWLDGSNPGLLPNAWVQGHEPDWLLLYENDTPNRLSLPTYPFPKTRFWITPQAATPPAPVDPVAPEHTSVMARLKQRLPSSAPPKLPGTDSTVALTERFPSQMARLKDRLKQPTPPSFN